MKHVSDILKPLFAAAGRAGSLKMLFCNQLEGGWGDHVTDEAFTYMEKRDGPVSNDFDYYAEVPDSGIDAECFKGSKTLDEDLREGSKNARRDVQGRFPSLARRAAKWNLKPTTYEGDYAWRAVPWR